MPLVDEVILPLLTIPPPALLAPNCATPETKIPLATLLVMVPLLTIGPANVEPPWT